MPTASKPKSRHYVYLLECSDSTYYCGIAKDLGKRLALHNAGKASRYTRARGPVKVVYAEKKDGIGEALRREHEIKSFSRKEKQILIGSKK